MSCMRTRRDWLVEYVTAGEKAKQEKVWKVKVKVTKYTEIHSGERTERRKGKWVFRAEAMIAVRRYANVMTYHSQRDLLKQNQI